MPEDSAQLKLFPSCLHLERVDPARNMRRFYRMTIEKDLFGGTSLVRVWGRTAVSKSITMLTRGLAVNALMEFAQKKRHRWYDL